jgi:O-antigen/teichoic acid export membrane protein
MGSESKPLRQTLSRILMLLCGTVGTALLAFATQFLLARGLSVADYGRLAALLATVNLVTPLANCGMGWFLLNVFGKEGSAAVRWIVPAMKACALTATMSIVLLAGYIASGGFGSYPYSLLVAAMAVPMLLGQSLAEITAARLQLEERYRVLAIWQMVGQLGRSAVVVILFAAGRRDLFPILVGCALAGMLVATISIVSIDQVRRGRIRLVGDARAPLETAATPGLWPTVVEAYPYILITTFYLIYSQGNVTLVERLIGPEAAANYNIAYLVVAAAYLIPNVVYQKYLVAKIFRWWAQDRKMFSAVFHLGIAAHLVMGTLLMAVVAAAAPIAIPLLFGTRYAAAVPILVLLALGIPIRFVQHSYGSAFFARENVPRKVRYMGLAAAFSLGSSLVWIPWLGPYGAAISAVSAEFLLLLLYVQGVARHIEGLDIRATFRPAALRAALAHINAADSGQR